MNLSRGVRAMKPSILVMAALAVLGAAAAASPPKADSAAIVQGNNCFAFDLFRRLRSEEGNLFFSPYSIWTALALTSAGARGETASEMAHALRFPPQSELQPSLAALMRQLNAGGAKPAYQLNVANALWAAKDFTFRPEFLRLARDSYGADARSLDFAADPDGARATINGWVAQQTADKIRDLLARGDLGPDTRLVLTNAIYFKGTWALPFPKDRTNDQPFRASGGSRPWVRLMSQTAPFGYAEIDDFQALELPYGGKGLALLVLLPKHDTLAGLEQQLSAGLIDEVVGKLWRQNVAVYLPRFKTTARFELADRLKEMGMRLAFNDRSDLSGLALSREDLKISKVIHQAFVDVNEEGTEAAAATGVTLLPTAAVGGSPPPIPVFRADHPFVYLIRDTRNSSVLFLGRLAKPTK
jgi:serpin B